MQEGINQSLQQQLLTHYSLWKSAIFLFGLLSLMLPLASFLAVELRNWDDSALVEETGSLPFFPSPLTVPNLYCRVTGMIASNETFHSNAMVKKKKKNTCLHYTARWTF